MATIRRQVCSFCYGNCVVKCIIAQRQLFENCCLAYDLMTVTTNHVKFSKELIQKCAVYI